MPEKERTAVADADAGKLEDALSTLDTVIAEAPEHGSAYNNRAQVYRLLDRKEESRRDLDEAIRLEEAWLQAHTDDRGTKLFEKHRQVLKQAFTQRSILKQCVSRMWSLPAADSSTSTTSHCEGDCVLLSS